jgi:hypothetical protein
LGALRAALGPAAQLSIAPLRAPEPGRKRRRFQRLFDPGNRIILEQLLEPAGPLIE